MMKLAGFTVFAWLCLCAGLVRAAEDVPFVDVRAEYFWHYVHKKATDFKAIAASPNGAVGYSQGMPSRDAAQQLALSQCNERSKFNALRNPPAPPCEVLSTDTHWDLATARLDPDWQKPLAGKDQAMRKGRKYLANKSKGIILFVHGCDGLGDRVFTDVWGSYFNAIGYDFYAPDSFAVKRPKHVCGQMIDYPAEQVSKVWRLRIAQTQRTLADLRQKNPDKPIYLFGHSEGGLIVQMIETRVAGIIVSGEECGVLGAPVAAEPAVPLLYIWGEFDQYVNGLGLRIDATSPTRCSGDLAQHHPSFTILKGRSHIPWPWNPKVNSAVSDFLGAMKPSDVAAPSASKRDFANWKRTKRNKTFRNAKQHRAAAINKSGTSYMVWGLDNEEDARELALFGCSRATSKKANVFQSGRHTCSLVDVNGSAPKR